MAMTGEQVSDPLSGVPPAPSAAPAAPPRRVSSLVTRVQAIDVRNTWQVAAGAFLVPLGIVVILISWYGAAHTSYVQQQIPYMVSGSFIGLGMMVVGGLLYWAHWLYRIYDQADLHHAAAAARQDEFMERLIEAVTFGQGGAPSARVSHEAAPALNGSDPGLVATASGANVHRADCPIVARHSTGLRRLTVETAAGRPACRICQPVVSGPAG